jgi:Ca2+-binding RTX toxin-like protein
MMVKRTLLLLSVMVATLLAASGVALAVSKVCSSGSTQANPCSGTKNNDTLVGTGGVDYIKGLAGNDSITGGEGNDTTDGGGGNDTYSYRGAWGVDTLIDSSGTDALNFLGMLGEIAVQAYLTPELGENYATSSYYGDSGARINVSSGTIVEKVTGTAGG